MPIATMIAGPNGSGKSTLTAKLVQQGINLGEYLNADDIAALLVERDATTAVSGSLIAANISEQAQITVRNLRLAALQNGVEHCFETVMSHTSHIDHMLAARAAGFETRLFFVATESPQINVGRVSNRVLNGGHDVPPTRIIARYHRCLQNLPAAIAAADHCRIFDNSNEDHPLQVLAEISHGVIRHRVTDRNDLPGWWLEILLRLKGRSPLQDGPLDP